MIELGIFGTSGFARDVGDIARELGYVPFYIARSPEDADMPPGSGDVVLERDFPDRPAAGYAIGIGDSTVRRSVAERHADLQFPTLIHPSATFGFRQQAIVEACRGVIVTAGVRFSNTIAVGDFCVFNPNVTVGHDCLIESYVTVSPGATISGNVHLRACSYIGTGAAINQGQPDVKLVIGSGTVVGSGAVVTKSCDDDAVYAGVPARRLR